MGELSRTPFTVNGMVWKRISCFLALARADALYPVVVVVVVVVVLALALAINASTFKRSTSNCARSSFHLCNACGAANGMIGSPLVKLQGGDKSITVSAHRRGIGVGRDARVVGAVMWRRAAKVRAQAGWRSAQLLSLRGAVRLPKTLA